jgi:LPS-assembly protein
LQIRFRHQQRFTDRLSARLDVNYVNLQNFFRNLSELTEERAARNVESNLVFNYRDRNSAAYLLARYTRDLTAPNDTTLQRLPEIGYSLFDYRIVPLPVYFRFDGTGTNFWRRSGLSAQRGDFYPRLLWPVRFGPGVTLTPQAGIRETLYSRSTTDERSIHREGYPLGARLEVVASRTGASWTHIVQPSVTYEYVPFREVSDVPQFDEIDLLHRKHQVTAEFDNALLWTGDAAIAREVVYFRLTETYDVDRGRSGDPRPFSDLRQEAGLSPFVPLSLAVDAFYNFYERRYSAADTDLSVRGFAPLSLTVGHRFARGGNIPQKGDPFNPASLGERVSTSRINYITEKIVLRTGWGISLASKAYYDAHRGGFDEIDYGFRYEAQCWTFTLVYLDLKEKNELSFMIMLRGAGGFESRKMAGLF